VRRKRLPILLLHGDAEARMLADGSTFLGAALPHLDVEVTAAWSGRPDLLSPDAEPPPESYRREGIVPDVDIRQLLTVPHRLVILSPFAGVAVPVLRHRSGGSFLVHRGIRERWSGEAAARVARECSELPPMSASEASALLAPVIEELQARDTIVALCTAFRHVREPLDHRRQGGPPSLRERVRSTNLEIARLSQRTGCFVLDLDRALAEEGGAALAADCFGGDGRAAEIALEELLSLVFDALPDDAIAMEAT
jgi:hypothetical protein